MQQVICYQDNCQNSGGHQLVLKSLFQAEVCGGIQALKLSLIRELFKGKEFTFVGEWLRIKGRVGVVFEMSSNFAFYRDVWWGI